MIKGVLYTDGGSRGNPGHAGCGCILFDETLNLISFDAEAFLELTNNQAEYKALILGIKLAIKNNIDELVCYLDSELIVKQLNGEYKIKDEKIKAVKPLIDELCKNFKEIIFIHIPREKNKFADKLVNISIDAFEKGLK
jgi:ribonuclease HI